MGPHYDSPNESVIPSVEIAAHKRLPDKSRHSRPPRSIPAWHIAPRKALAAASVRRDHEPIVKLQ
jgi:hypothetical protein